MRRITAPIRRRAAVEPVIGHIKAAPNGPQLPQKTRRRSL